MAIQAQPIDPRDARWEYDQPAYRVYFWQDGVSDEWHLTGADVDKVLDWARDQAGGRAYVVYACIDNAEGRGLIRLLGPEHS